VILAFYVIVFMFIEVPIAGFVLAPDATRGLSLNAKSRLDSNMLRLAYWALAVVGAFQIIRGLITGIS
jgi:hypothetical protein